MSSPATSVEEGTAALRAGLEEVRRVLARLPDPPEPLTACELACWATSGCAPRDGDAGRRTLPAPPEDRTPGTIAHARAELAAGRLSAEDLVGESLDRARAACGLGAFLLLREEEALAEARRAPKPDPERPLAGIPVSLKDIFDVEGLTTTSGSKFPRTPTRNAPAWAALERAGAILLGKNNLQEFAFGVDGNNPTFGRARNPHDPARITGGSSSGSAVAVAVGAGRGSLGTDTGGSIRIPAALTGIFGLKPSYGAVSREGVTPLSWSLDHVGPLARSAADLAALFEALTGQRLPASSPPPADSAPLAGVRVGVPLDFFYSDLTREARQTAESVVAAMERLGAERVEVRIPEVELAGPCRSALAFAEAAEVHRTRLAARPEDISGEIRALLEVGGALSAGELLTAFRGRRLVCDAFRRVFERVDLLLVPSTPAGAPEFGAPLATGEDIRPGLIRLVGPFNLAGLPALSAPAGRDDHGMPLGVQLVGAWGDEAAVLSAAAWLEAEGALGALPPPPLPDC